MLVPYLWHDISMKILITNQSELPIYAQIREQIKEQILNGQLKEGEALPSIRQLAKEIGVSVITTTRAYNDLEQEGFITAMQGKGTIVLSRENDLLREQYLKRMEEGLFTAVKTARMIKMTKEELLEICENLWESEEDKF